MPLRFLQARTPSVKAVSAQKKSVNAWIFAQRFRSALRQLHHILRVFQNRQPLAVLVRSPALQTLQHFVTFERQPSLRRMSPGEYGTPHRVRVQHCSRA